MAEAPVTERAPTAGRTIEQSVEIAAPIEAVWKALTDADELVRWFPLEARVNPGPGGSIWMSWKNEYQWETPIEIWDPPRRLRLSYGLSSQPTPGGTLETDPSFGHLQVAIDYHLEARGGGTFLRLVHSGFGPGSEWDEEFDATNRGWIFELGSLRHYLERHRGVARDVVYARVRIDLPREEAWSRVLGADGLRAPAAGALRPGARYALATATGDALEGRVLAFEPPKAFEATVANLNDALMRLNVDDLPLRKVRDVTLWIQTYGLPADQVAALRARWEKKLLELFPGSQEAGA
jgi:uncharacterized protein YndB with AHSA1/START domain